VRLRDGARDEEPEPCPGLRATARVDAAELLEHEPLLLGGDPRAVILDAQDHRFVLRYCAYLDLVARDGVLGRVREEVEEQLAEPVAIPANHR
jgi:hypothetical protein